MNDSSQVQSKDKTESDFKNRRKSKDLITQSITQSGEKGTHKIDSSLTGNNQNFEPKSACGTDWKQFQRQNSTRKRRPPDSSQLNKGSIEALKRSTSRRSDA